MLEDTDTRLAVHEAICTERYSNIDRILREGEKRMAKIEYLLYAVIIAVLLGPTAAAQFVSKIFGL